MMCHCRFTGCHKCSTLSGDVDNGGGNIWKISVPSPSILLWTLSYPKKKKKKKSEFTKGSKSLTAEYTLSFKAIKCEEDWSKGRNALAQFPVGDLGISTWLGWSVFGLPGTFLGLPDTWLNVHSGIALRNPPHGTRGCGLWTAWGLCGGRGWGRAESPSQWPEDVPRTPVLTWTHSQSRSPV